MAKAASSIAALFPTLIYRAELAGDRFNRRLATASLELAAHDRDGQRWCQKHGYAGYTSYASIDDLVHRDTAFASLETIVERHAARFAKALRWELRGGAPRCDTMWVNLLLEGGSHTGHLHANAVLSGAYYVTAPEGSSPIVFEDPRHAMMMAAPPRRAKSPREHLRQVPISPLPGTLLLWESWLRHEVPLNRSAEARISVSFNLIVGAPD